MPATTLVETLEAAFQEWDQHPQPWSDERFGALALEAFALQFDENLPYGRYCRAIGVDPTSVNSWREIPPAPTAAFRSVDLTVGDPADAVLRFRTSGTTRGESERGVHPIPRPATYAAALRGPFRHAVLAGGDEASILLLHGPFSRETGSSLAWMFDEVLTQFGGAGSARLNPGDGLTARALTDALEYASKRGAPIIVLGTTLALAEAAGLLDHADTAISLPTGSRVMDTGGSKGRPGLDRRATMSALVSRLGLDEGAAVNEFGMTELLSQRYGPGLEDVWLTGPPWLRTRVLDPVTLDELPDGIEGLLCHYDLANVGSVVAVLTEDRGRARGEAIQWLGRTPGAVPRGCSLATAELLEAQS
jgi:hypothetical protein